MTSRTGPPEDPGPRDPELRDLRMVVRDRVAVVTLDRPDRRNAFTGAMGDSLGRAYERCDLDDEIRAVVLTGAGDAFCAGADLGGGGDTFGAVGDDPRSGRRSRRHPCARGLGRSASR